MGKKGSSFLKDSCMNITNFGGVKKEKEKFHVTPTQKISVLLSKMGKKNQKKKPLEENTECFICCEIKPFFNVFRRLKLTQL